MKYNSLQGHLVIKTDIEPTTSNKFKLDDHISKAFSISERDHWGYVRTDWTLVDDAALRLALMLGNALRYDDVPLYIYCLRAGVRNHNLAITSNKNDRARLISFAEGLVDPITANLITIHKNSEIFKVPNGRQFLDDTFCGKSGKYEIAVKETPISDIRKLKLDLIGLVFEDNDHFDIVDIMMNAQSVEV